MAADRNDLVQEQQAPTPNDRPAVWDLVIADMQARDADGRRKYGVPLQAMNGRDPLVDAYQESLDQSVYLRQAIEERRELLALATAWEANAKRFEPTHYGLDYTYDMGVARGLREAADALRMALAEAP